MGIEKISSGDSESGIYENPHDKNRILKNESVTCKKSPDNVCQWSYLVGRKAERTRDNRDVLRFDLEDKS